METVEYIIDSISTVGFPIVMALMMFNYFKKVVEQVNNAITENTKVLTTLVERLKENE